MLASQLDFMQPCMVASFSPLFYHCIDYQMCYTLQSSVPCNLSHTDFGHSIDCLRVSYTLKVSCNFYIPTTLLAVALIALIALFKDFYESYLATILAIGLVT